MSNCDIAVGTTPTIIYTFSKVNPLEITNAILTFERLGQIILEKDLSDATVGEKTLSWTLTQEETLGIGVGYAEVMLNWLDIYGTRGIGKRNKLNFIRNHKDEVMV